MKKLTYLNKTALPVLLLFLLTLCSVKVSAEDEKSPSHRFFAFADAEYHTSPDKRIGAKILADPVKVGPSIASLVHMTYLPGAHIKSHRHVFVTEIIHVLEGNLTLRIDDESKVMGPNSTAFIPAKTFHEYFNDSTDVVKFLQYFSPAGPEEEYRNWTKASEAASAREKKEAEAAAEVEAPKTTRVVTPANPAVRGSPATVIRGVEVKDSETGN